MAKRWMATICLFSGTQSKQSGRSAWHEGLRSLPALTTTSGAQSRLSGGIFAVKQWQQVLPGSASPGAT